MFLNDPYFKGKYSHINLASSRAEIANAMMAAYSDKVKLFHDAGMKSFMTDSVPGDNETFYTHAVCNYFLPKICTIYTLHGVGPGVFSMEGFEYKNFQSKRAVANRANGRGNICKQSIRHLCIIFRVGTHDIKKELKKRSASQKRKWHEKYFKGRKIRKFGNNDMADTPILNFNSNVVAI